MFCLQVLEFRDDASRFCGIKIDADGPNSPQNEKHFLLRGQLC